MSTLATNGKRLCEEKDISPIPLKKQRQRLCLDAIRNIKQPFHPHKLRINNKYSQQYANDILFNQQPSTKQSKHIRWVLACKFMIASQLRLGIYDVLGMQRNKIPNNMYFYVDDHKNLCAVIQHSNNNHIATKIIHHCNHIETSMIESYVNGESALYPQCVIDVLDAEVDEDEDDDLWTPSSLIAIDQDNSDNIISVIRVPIIYYILNMQSSFYELCCRISAFLNQNSNFGHPLFGLFGKYIANFDCFKLSVPMVPLTGKLHEMFYQYALGRYSDDNEVANIQYSEMSKKEFVAFLGAYHCWNFMQYKQKCRKAMYQCWTRVTQTDINIMNVVIEFADFHQMSNQELLEFVNHFSPQSREYRVYLKELKRHIANLETIVDFNGFGWCP